MTNRNTMSRGRFLLSHAIWWAVSLFLFRYFVFIPLEGRTEADSFKLLRSAVAFAVCAAQFCEISADCHAEEAAAIYYNMIWDYENKEMEK
ncbi:MAG: hypothetical protein IKD18_06560 [Clostridia bacterium]|nr:hypothetical protein [Clostridia bacterium]